MSRRVGGPRRTQAVATVLAIALLSVAASASAAGASEDAVAGDAPACASGYRARSAAIPCPREWHERSFLLPHEAIRVLMARLQRAMEASEDVNAGWDAWKASAVRLWFDEFFVPVVAHHHDAEEAIYFPWMDQITAARGADMPPLAETTHAEVVAAIHAVGDALRRLEDGARVATGEARGGVLLDGARRATRDMLALLEKHLLEEERLYPPLLAQYSTEREERGVIDTIIKDLGFYGNKVMLPTIWEAMLHWSGPRGVAKLEEVLPVPVRLLNRWVFMPNALYNSIGIMEAVAQGHDPGIRPMAVFYRHAEMLGLAVLCATLVGAAFFACRAPRITNPRSSGRGRARRGQAKQKRP